MRGTKISDTSKEECIRLRIQERLSYAEIYKKTGVAKGSLSIILKNYPLTEKEKKEKMDGSGRKYPERNKRLKYYQMTKNSNLSRQDKAKIAEAAILFRLCLMKYIVYGSPFDGDKADWLIERQDSPGKTKRIQVRWVKQGTTGLPIISLLCMEHGEQKRFQKGDFDFIIGYCLYTDTAYIYSFQETKHLKTSVTISKESSEAWTKINLWQVCSSVGQSTGISSRIKALCVESKGL